jgi:hypothetical protein
MKWSYRQGKLGTVNSRMDGHSAAIASFSSSLYIILVYNFYVYLVFIIA